MGSRVACCDRRQSQRGREGEGVLRAGEVALSSNGVEVADEEEVETTTGSWLKAEVAAAVVVTAVASESAVTRVVSSVETSSWWMWFYVQDELWKQKGRNRRWAGDGGGLTRIVREQVAVGVVLSTGM